MMKLREYPDCAHILSRSWSRSGGIVIVIRSFFVIYVNLGGVYFVILFLCKGMAAQETEPPRGILAGNLAENLLSYLNKREYTVDSKTCDKDSNHYRNQRSDKYTKLILNRCSGV